MNKATLAGFDPTQCLALPPLFEVDPRVLTLFWREFCMKQKIRMTAAIMYANPLEQQKLWAAAGIIVDGISRGLHAGKKRIVDSTSGNFGEALAYVVRLYRERFVASFPIEEVIAVITKSTPAGKRERLSRWGITLVEAEDALDAQRVARELAKQPDVWYTEQYWNPANGTGAYGRVGRHLVSAIPHIGAFVAGVGSGGSFSGCVESMEQALGRTRAFYRTAVVVEPGSKVPGVRDPIALEPGTLPWRERADDIRLVSGEAALAFSHMLWQQSGCVAGPSSGFATIGGLWSAFVLWTRRDMDHRRSPDGYFDIVTLFPDTRKPYRGEYEEAGFALPPNDEWDLPIAA